MKKLLHNLFFKNIVTSIAVAAILISLILISHMVFESFKIGFSHLQIMLIIYSIGIYKIRNLWVNAIFFITVPFLIFFHGSNPAYLVNIKQIATEYFFSYYIFALILIPSSFLASTFRDKPLSKIFDYLIFCGAFIISLFSKYMLHVYATLTWFSDSVQSTLTAFIYNFTNWLSTNLLLIPIIFIVTLPIFKVFNMLDLNQKNKW